MEYMEHGSLYDLLHNRTIRLDGGVLKSIVKNVIDGMRFLQGADPGKLHCLANRNVTMFVLSARNA